MTRQQYAKFTTSAPLGEFHIYILKQNGCTDKDLRTDAFTVMITEFGRVASLKQGFELVKTLPDSAQANRKYSHNNTQWAYVARAN